MMLVLDFRGGERAFGQDGGGKDAYWSVTSERDDLGPLESVFKEKDLDAVAVFLPREGEKDTGGMTWSSIRAAVSVGNAIGFASGIPVVRVDMDDPELTREELIERAREAVKEAPQDSRVAATYSGRPNITTPKS